jgi:hypothetical protein
MKRRASALTRKMVGREGVDRSILSVRSVTT